MVYGSLFSGIGGFDLGFDRASNPRVDWSPTYGTLPATVKD
jgi:site-specific DNA-cytosine methylase